MHVRYALLFVGLCAVPARAADLLSVSVEKEDGVYHMVSEVWFDAAQQHVYDVFADWDVATRFSSFIVESRDIGPDDHRTDFFVTYELPVRDDGTTLTTTVFMKDAFGNDVRRAGAVSAGLFWFGQRVAERQWGVELTLRY